MSHIHKPEEFELSNGIPVILQHLAGPVGTIHWWVQTGSTDEHPHEAGFAHFLEHMLFKDAAAKDTGKASTGQTARAIESFGGDINAYTSFDQTVYHVTCSEMYWEKIIDTFGTMAKPQRFLKSDFQREREVILEELRRGNDSPDRQTYEKLFSNTFKKHPYGKPVIGFEKILKKATVNTLETFYKRNYVSARMGIILVGPIEDEKGLRKKKLLALLEKRFGKNCIPKRAAPERKRPVEPALATPSLKSLHFSVKNPSIALAFRVPEIDHPDIAALEVLSAILGMGESARLHQKLFYEKQVCTEVGASVYVPKDPGMFILNADIESTEKADEFLAALDVEIAAVKEHLTEPHELERVITNIESEKLYSTQTVDGVAGRLGFLRFNIGNLHYDGEYLEEIKAVTAEDIRTAARKYLIPERMTGVILQPKGEENYKWPKSFLGADVKTPKPAKLKKPVGDQAPRIFETAHGLKVVHFEKPGSHVAAVHLSAMGGSRLETKFGPEAEGASNILAQTWTKGTTRLNSKQLANFVENRAASIDGFSGKNTIGLQMTSLVRDWKDMSPLFLEVLTQPAFTEEELALSRKVTEESIRSIPDHSSQVCTLQFLESVMPNHPYGKSSLGSIENLIHHNTDQMKKIHKEWIQPKNMTLSVVGGVNETQLNIWLEEFEKHFQYSQKHFGDEDPLPEAPLKAPRWAHTHFGREQTHIIVGGLGLSMFDPRRSALRILHSILGGQSGRLFIELREKKSMAYSVSPISMEGIEPGYIGTYIACAPTKRKEAVLGIREVLETLAKKGPTSEEIERARNYTIGQRSMDLQAVWSQAAAFGLEALYKGKIESEKEYADRLRKVTKADVQKICRELYLDANQATVFVS